MKVLSLCLMLTAGPALADQTTWTATRVIRADSVILGGDVKSMTDGAVPMVSPVGLEARVVLYPGRPIRPSEVGPVSVVDRNDLVTLIYAMGGLRISAEGRALDRGSAGDRIRVLNAASRETVFGVVDITGKVRVE